jgi:hypothetical protein
VLEGLEKDVREARKGLWADPQPVPDVGRAEEEVKILVAALLEGSSAS